MARHPHLTEMDRVARARRKASREALDLDVETFVRQVKALPVFADCPRPIARTRVVLVHSAFQHGGRAHGNRMARIRVSPSTPLWWVLETIVHELVHCALPARVSHNERFRLTLARAVRELWGLDVDPNPKEQSGRVARYGLDKRIEQHLECELAEGRLPYPRLAPEAPEAREARLVAEARDRIDTRARHAARMLALAQTRLKRAKTIERKWRLRVQRYERAAAKR